MAAATLRERFGVSIDDVGGRVSWGEAWSLLSVAAGDPSTRLGAVIAGWAYPARPVEVLQLAAQVGKSYEQVMPWSLQASGRVTADEVERARAELAKVSAFRGLPGFE